MDGSGGQRSGLKGLGRGLGNGAGQGSVGHEEGSREGSGERTEWSHDGSRRARKGI